MASALLLVTCLGSCKKDKDEQSSTRLPIVQFGAVSYTLSGEYVDIKIVCSANLKKNTMVNFTLGGTAVEDTDYILSSNSFEVLAGTSTAIIRVTSRNFSESYKNISLELEPNESLELGRNAKSEIAIKQKEPLAFNFNVKSLRLMTEYEIKLTVTKIGGAPFTALEPIVLPVKILDGATAVLGTDYIFKGGSITSLTIPKGENSAAFTLIAKSGKNKKFTFAINNDPVAIGRHMVPGKNPNVEITIPGPLMFDQITGPWKCQGIIGLDSLKKVMADKYDESETTLLPTATTNFWLNFSGSTSAGMRVSPLGVGSLTALFRASSLEFHEPMNNHSGSTIVNDTHSTINETYNYSKTENIQLTYFKLEKANRAFSTTTVNEGEMVVGMWLNAKGNLEIYLRDTDMPPFLQAWYPDYERMGLGFEFTKVR